MNDQVGISLYNISSILSKRVMRIKKISINPLSPTSDLDRISPYTISTISSIQVMRKRKISIRRLLVDLIPDSPN